MAERSSMCLRFGWHGKNRKKTLDEVRVEASRASSHGEGRPGAGRPSPRREENVMHLTTVRLIFSSVLLLSAFLLSGGCAIIRPQAYKSFFTHTPPHTNSYL